MGILNKGEVVFNKNKNILSTIRVSLYMGFIIQCILLSMLFNQVKYIFNDEISLVSSSIYDLRIPILFICIIYIFILIATGHYRKVYTNERIIIRNFVTGKIFSIYYDEIEKYEIKERNNFKKIYVILQNRKRYMILKYHSNQEKMIADKVIERIKFFVGTSNTILKRDKDKTLKQRLLYLFVTYLMIGVFLLGILLNIFYVIDYNEEFGNQKNYIIKAIVEEKKRFHSGTGGGKGTPGFYFEDEKGKNYEAHVDENIYAKFEEGDSIIIECKKGSLGVTYDVNYYEKQ